QFATAGALDLLRSFRDEPEKPETLMLAATDPANPYGALVKWPAQGLTRSVGARVIIVNGALAGYVTRGEQALKVFLPEDEPSRDLKLRCQNSSADRSREGRCSASAPSART